MASPSAGALCSPEEPRPSKWAPMSPCNPFPTYCQPSGFRGLPQLRQLAPSGQGTQEIGEHVWVYTRLNFNSVRFPGHPRVHTHTPLLSVHLTQPELVSNPAVKKLLVKQLCLKKKRKKNQPITQTTPKKTFLVAFFLSLPLVFVQGDPKQCD